MERREIVKEFRLRHLTLRADALKPIESVLAREVDPEAALNDILDNCQSYLEKETGVAVVDLACVTSVVAAMSRNEEDIAKESIEVFSSFSLPKIDYDAAARLFRLETDTSKFSLHAKAPSKVAKCTERFRLIQERLLRHPTFTPPLVGIGGDEERSYFTLTSVESARSASPDTELVLLGMLTQPMDGAPFLEDLRGKIRLLCDKDEMKKAPGFFTETSIVLVQGMYFPDEDALKVTMLGMPMSEPREASLTAMGIIDPMNAIKSPTDFSRAIDLQVADENACFVYMSDVHLDNADTFKRLREMLSVFESSGSIPSMFVLIGNFLSKPFGLTPTDRTQFKHHMTELAALIASFPAVVANTRFAFVPGPNDPGAAGVLPRPPLPASMTEPLSKALGESVTFCSNPCRIRFYTQEIVVFRSDSLSRLRRHTLIPCMPTEGEDSISAVEQLARTIIDQGHLCPLPAAVQPVYWEYDYALRVYPAPDMIVLADEGDAYEADYESCKFVNPGSLACEGEFGFYRAAAQEYEASTI